MQRKLLISVLLSLIITSAAPVRLVRLTVINKSGMPIDVQLNGSYDENLYYYLRVAPGDRLFPTSQTFTITPDIYSMRIYYIEYYDPVYGFKCGQPTTGRLTIPGTKKIVVLPCTQRSAGTAGLILRLLFTPRYRY